MTVSHELEQAIGVALAVGSALAYAATNVLIRRGSRAGLPDHGLLLTLAVNVLILLPVAMVGGLGLTGPRPGIGIIWYATSGLLAGFMGRIALFGGIVRIGSSRASSLKNAAPIVAVASGVLLLGERLDVQSWVGVTLCLIGVGVLVRNREPITPSVGEAVPLGPDLRTTGSADRPADRPVRIDVNTRLVGIACGLGAALFFGLAQTTRKAGTTDLPDPLLGALIAIMASFGSYVAYLAAHGRLVQIAKASVRHANRDLVAAGLTSTVGMLAFLISLTILPVSVASVVASAEVMFTVILAALVLRRMELVTLQVVGASCLVCVGAVVLSSS